MEQQPRHNILVDTSEKWEHLFFKKNPKSKEAFDKAKKILPGGNTREVIFYKPFPLFVKKGKGCWIWDIDDHKILDFLNNYLALILGHAHNKIIKAVKSQIDNGTAFSAPTEYEYQLGNEINDRMSSIKNIRFTNSGSEATILVIQAAKGYTGRKKIAKCEGAHHGTNELTMVSTTPSLEESGNPDKPNSIADGPHISDYILKNTLVLPFNKTEASEKLLIDKRKELAAVIIEPILGSAGIIPAKKEFIDTIREITEKNDIPLIFDEVVTGFRVSRGGAQELYDVTPDITALGKNLGGGFPLGAFGGREDIMAQFDPSKKIRISHSGSLNANPICLRAGLALLNELTNDNYTKLEKLGSEVGKGLRQVFEDNKVDAQVTQIGSLFGIHFTSEEIVDYRSSITEDPVKKFNFFLRLLLNDVMIAPKGVGCISTPMSDEEIKILLYKVNEIIVHIKEK